jgi:transketolase
MPGQNAALDQQCINTIRFLSAEAVQRANSGHPGAPMGAAAMVYTVWDRFLKHSPANPHWPNRDRFILSAGHASMLLYSLLHLTGYELSLDELKNFRQWGSKTPGHPEFGETPGVEATTGPLGQGFANGVGMAVAERMLAAEFNTAEHTLIDHHIYAMVSDGDLQEGVSAEAASLAGHLGLGKLIYLYDDNKVQIEGGTDLAFTEDVAKRFEGYRWHVQGPIDGNDLLAVENAVKAAQDEKFRPSIILCKTVIGYGSPKQGTAKVHGEPLGDEGLSAAKKELGWPEDSSFLIPDEVKAHMAEAVSRGKEQEAAWESLWKEYQAANPEKAEAFQLMRDKKLPMGWDEGLEELFAGSDPVATRAASGTVLNHLAKKVTALAGGSADLAPSTKTIMDGRGHFQREEPEGRNMHFGVREHAMGSMAMGMAYHGMLIPYTATFLTFSDYMRPPMRLAALSKLRMINVFTHDSIGLGEDGPTHQPIEHYMALRAVPNLTFIRPADAAETAYAWAAAIANQHGPTALALTRQKLPLLDRSTCAPAKDTLKGAYVLWASGDGQPDVILMGTGSETHIALEAGQALAGKGKAVSVVSMPSWELFDAQSDAYKESVLPKAVRARVAVEAGTTLGWERYVGLDGAVVGIDRFGASAPYTTIYEKLGITAEAVVAAAEGLGL